MDNFTEFGESKLFQAWEVNPFKDLWSYFKYSSRLDLDKKDSVYNQIKWRKLKHSLAESIEKPDFFRYIYGRKVTSNKYYADVFHQIFGWHSIEENLELSRGE